MKRIPALLFTTIIATLCVAFTVNRTKTKRKYEISGTLLVKHDYCGGANISNSDIKTTYAVNGQTLYIRRAGNAHVIDSIVSDSVGNFFVKLEAGRYDFVEKWKTEKFEMPQDNQNETWDTACYRKDYKSPDFFLQISQNKSNVAIVITRHCTWTRPCCSFHGPTPPAAPPHNRGGYQPGHQE